MNARFAFALLAGALGAGAVLPATPAYAFPVFDGANYTQNLLTAARTLRQINQQIQSLQNEASMLALMGRNLERIEFPELAKLRDNLVRIEELMEQADGIGFGVDQLEKHIDALFPENPGSRSRVADASARLDAARSAYRRTLRVQAQIVANIEEDARHLAALAGRSTAASGSLAATQATNQILALAAKQQMQLQQMMAAQFRAQSIERSRAAQIEADARAATSRFLGDGKAYRSN